MSLMVCPGCDRHVHEGEVTCPFCGADASPGRAGAARGISRRQLTRAAVWTGAVLVLNACGGGEEEDDRRVDDGTGGGEDVDDDVVVIDATDEDDVHVVGGGGSGGGGDGDVVVVEGDLDGDGIVDDANGDGVRDDEQDWRRRRRGGCQEPNDPSCVAMPYGAPPSPDLFV